MNASALSPAHHEEDVVERASGTSSAASARSFAARASPWVRRLEWATVILVGCLSVALHLRFVTSVGGLWRDEANSAHLATLPAFADVCHFLDYDSFPILFFTILRGWLGVFGADNDAALRALGFVIGLGVLAALWLNSRAFGARLPVLSLALIGLNPMLIRYCDSSRAYGLGILLILLTLRSFWRLVEAPGAPGAKRTAVAMLLALLSVQCLYYNAVLLLAIAAGTVTVAAMRRAWRTAGIVFGMGIVSAVSLLPYVPMMRRMREWTFLVSYPADFAWLWKRGCEVIGSPDPILVWIWSGLFVAAIGLAVVAAVLTIRGNRRLQLPPAIAFVAVTLVVAVPGYASFLNVLNYYTQPWYYITIVAFAACLIDIVFGVCGSGDGNPCPILKLFLRGVRIGVAFALVGLAGLPAWGELPTRHTNVDLVAARLQPLTKQGDLILVSRWECAIPLCRYYHGEAEIMTLPPIEDHRFHRYDLVLRQLMKTDAAQSVLTRMEAALRSGHRVFLAGELPFPEVDTPVPDLAALHREADGEWHGTAYSGVWRLQAGYLLRAHAVNATHLEVRVPGGAGVQEHEDLKLAVFNGWR